MTRGDFAGSTEKRTCKGFWFIPDDHIFKDNALKRISKNELNIEYNIEQSEFLGIYKHFCDNYISNNDFSTHRIVVGFGMSLEKSAKEMKAWHEAYRWFLLIPSNSCLKF